MAQTEDDSNIPNIEQTEPKNLQPESSAPETESENQDAKSVAWTASEFVAHDKSAGWYAILVIVTLVLAAGIFLLTKDLVSVGVVIVAGLLLGVYAGHQPRQLEYSLDSQGFGIGQKHYSYDQFKWFSVIEDEAFSSIVFMPLKRFSPAITIYYPPEDEDKIVSILTNQLPVENHKLDAIDSLMKRIRF